MTTTTRARVGWRKKTKTIGGKQVKYSEPYSLPAPKKQAKKRTAKKSTRKRTSSRKTSTRKRRRSKS